MFKIINNYYFFSTETSICSRNIFKYANQWMKTFHRLNRRTQFKSSSTLKNLCFLKSHCLLRYKEKAVSKEKSEKKFAKKCRLKNERMCKHLCNIDIHTHSTLKIKIAIFTTAFPKTFISLEKRPWPLLCKHVASWSKFSSSVGLKIKFSSCWQGRCVCIRRATLPPRPALSLHMLFPWVSTIPWPCMN